MLLADTVGLADDLRWAADFIKRELNTHSAWARADRLRAVADEIDRREAPSRSQPNYPDSFDGGPR